MSEIATICPDCGNAVPRSAMGGLCPFCLASSVAAELEDSQAREVVTGMASELRYERIGPYRLLDQLGEGAFGVVFRAEQEGPLRRTVAIKILKPGVATGQAVARFEAERQALAMMEHPGIARVYDVGETKDGLPYFVMELIDGMPISSFCETKRLPLEARLRLFCEVCEAVAHAHRRGIIHRDLKPSNILVVEDGGEAVVKVIDFGIAKATDAVLTERTLLTRDHQLVGTPAYMSPEQAGMRGWEIDTRADIYSLGVVLYELLTGTTPFPVDQLAALPYDEALRRIRTEDPPRPSARSRERTNSGSPRDRHVAELSSGLGRDLDWIVMKALEKEPDRRYETAGALGRDLECYLAGEAVEARPPTATYLAAKFVRKNRVPVIAVLAVLGAMVIGSVVSLFLYLEAREQAIRARDNEKRAGMQADLVREHDERGRRIFSGADFHQAGPLLGEGRPARAVAHLVRALRTHPENHAAASRLLYTLAAENWARPIRALPAHGGSLAYTPDGTRVLALDLAATVRGHHQEIRIFHAETGEEERPMRPRFPATSFVVDPHGRTVVIGESHGQASIWDFEERVVLKTVGARVPGRHVRVVLSDDGRYLATTYVNHRVVEVWEVETGDRLAAFNIGEGQTGFTTGRAAFSRDGSRLAFAFDRKMRLFDWKGGEEEGQAMSHDGEIMGLAMLPDGRRLVTWSVDSTARLWDGATGDLLKILPHEQPVRKAALSPDGSRLLTGTGLAGGDRASGFSRLWDLESGLLIGSPIPHHAEVPVVAFSPDGSKAATGCLIHGQAESAVRVLDGWTGELLMAPIFHPRGATALAFHPDGTRIAMGSRHSESAIWEIQPSAFRPVRIQARGAIWRAVFDRDDQSVITITYGGDAMRWSAADGSPLSIRIPFGPTLTAGLAGKGRDSLRHGFHARRAHRQGEVPSLLPPRFGEGTPEAAAASEDGNVVVTACRDGTVRCWDVVTGKSLVEPLRHGSVPVTAVALDSNGRFVVSGAGDGSVKLWDLESASLVGERKMLESAATAVGFSPDNGTVAAAGRGGEARLWWLSRPAGSDLSAPMDNRRHVNHLAFSPDGSLLASAGKDNAARVWEVTSGELACGPLRHIDDCSFGLLLLWSPDSRRLVTTGSHDDTARCWDVHSGEMLAKSMEQPTAAISAALRPDGKALLYGDDFDFQARVWDLDSGEPITPFLKHDGRIYSSAFDSTGGRVVTATPRGTAFIWDVPGPQGTLPSWLLDYAEAVAGFRFNENGVLAQVPPAMAAAAHDEMQRRAVGLPESALGDWVRWLAADPMDRSISPHATVTVHDYVERLIAHGTTDHLREAHHLRPGDPEVVVAWGEALETREGASASETIYGSFLRERGSRSDSSE